MRTSNPVLNNNVFSDALATGAASPNDVMTAQGAVSKTGFLLAFLMMSAAWTWHLARVNPAAAMPWMIGGMIAGAVLALATVFKPVWAPFTSPLYALAEGLALGGISAFFEARFPGIVIQGVGATFCVLAAMLMAYKLRIIRATEKFKLGVVAATGGIALLYLVSIVLSFFGVRIGFIHEPSLLGIGFSIVVVVVAALNLVLDFDFIERGAEEGAPKYMEWYGAFGLMVTLVWLYLEILRLLSKLRER